MERAKLSRSLERVLRCTEDLARACTAVDVVQAEVDKALGPYMRAAAGFEKDRKRDSHLTQTKKVAAVAKDWLDAYQDAQVFDKLPALLAVVQRSAEIAALSTNSPVCRYV